MGTDSHLTRARAATRIVLALEPSPDVVMLQEVTSVPGGEQGGVGPAMLDVFRNKFVDAGFEMYTKSEDRMYFDVMFVKKDLFEDGSVKSECTSFEGSAMGRAFVKVEGVLKKGCLGWEEAGFRKKVCFLTSHLESEKAGAVQRKVQFAKIIEMMRENAKEGTVTIFGGDTNLREGEISGAVVSKGAAETKEREASADRPVDKCKISDAYVQSGSEPSKKFTWDMDANDNLKVDWEFKPKSRYDRVFVFGPAKHFPVCHGWDLVGRTRLECGVFPSDHWGVVTDITICGKLCEQAKTAKRIAKRSAEPIEKTNGEGDSSKPKAKKVRKT